MSIFIPKKVIETVSKAIFQANNGKLKATVGVAVYSVDFDYPCTNIHVAYPDNNNHSYSIALDKITADSMAEALTRCYIYDAEKERNYRVKLELRVPNPDEPNKTTVVCTYWVGRTGEQPWIEIQRYNWPRAIHFDLNQL